MLTPLYGRCAMKTARRAVKVNCNGADDTGRRCTHVCGCVFLYLSIAHLGLTSCRRWPRTRTARVRPAPAPPPTAPEHGRTAGTSALHGKHGEQYHDLTDRIPFSGIVIQPKHGVGSPACCTADSSWYPVPETATHLATVHTAAQRRNTSCTAMALPRVTYPTRRAPLTQHHEGRQHCAHRNEQQRQREDGRQQQQPAPLHRLVAARGRSHRRSCGVLSPLCMACSTCQWSLPSPRTHACLRACHSLMSSHPVANPERVSSLVWLQHTCTCACSRYSRMQGAPRVVIALLPQRRAIARLLHRLDQLAGATCGQERAWEKSKRHVLRAAPRTRGNCQLIRGPVGGAGSASSAAPRCANFGVHRHVICCRTWTHQ